MRNLKLFALIQLGVTLVGSLILAEGRDNQSAASFALGAGLVLANVMATVFVWSRVIQKKLIALSLTIIVSKYAILGIIIYKLLSLPWVHQMWLCAGLASLVVSTLFFASVVNWGQEDDEKKEDEESDENPKD